MDPITHGLLGATTSQAFFVRRLKKHAWIVGGLAAMAPDLDVLIHSASNPLLGIYYHRLFTHSLIFIPIGGFIVGLLYWLLCRLFNKAPPFWLIIAASILAYATHCLLDTCTSYGTVLFWPFSLQRFSWDIVSIVDPIYTGILLIGMILSAIYRRKLFAILALIISTTYLLFLGWLHHEAKLMQQQLITSRHQTAENTRVMPEMLHYYAWRSIYVADGKIYIDQITTPIIGKNQIYTGINLPQFLSKNLPANISATQKSDYKIFNWFTDGFVSVFNQKPLVLVDMRYLRQIKPAIGMWGIAFNSSENHITWMRWIVQNNQAKSTR